MGNIYYYIGILAHLSILVAHISADAGYLVTVGGDYHFDTSDGAEPTATAQALIVANDTFHGLPDYAQKTFGVAMAELGGVVYGVGGTMTGNKVFLYNGTSNKWQSSKPLSGAGVGQGATVVSMGDALFIVGGQSSPSSLNIWRPEAVTPGPKPTSPHVYSGGAAYQGKIYVCGMADEHFRHYNSNVCEVFDGKSWNMSKSMLVDRRGFGMVALQDKIYAIGGSEATNERFDPKNGTWSYIAQLHTPRYYHAVATDGQYVYALGGQDKDAKTMYDTIEQYDPAADTWKVLTTKLSQGRCSIGAAFVTSLGETSN